MIALGYGTVRGGLFAATDMRILGKYVLNIALPVLLFNAVSRRDFSETLDGGYLLVVLLGGLSTLGITYLWFWLRNAGPARRAVAAMGASVPNSAYIGFPIMLLVFPDIAGLILAMNMIVENFVIIPLCLILMDGARPANTGLFARLGSVFLSVLKRPLVFGLLLGLCASLFGLTLPVAIVRLLDMIAASSAALALMIIGGSLVGLPLVGNWGTALQIAGAKLLLHPALVILIMAALIALGLPVPVDDFATAAILSAAMPMFGIYALLAQEGGQEGLASLALVATTAIAFFTLSVILGLLG